MTRRSNVPKINLNLTFYPINGYFSLWFFEQNSPIWPSVGYLAQWRITIRRRWLDDGRVCVVTRRSNFPKINLCRATHLTLLTRRRRRLAASEIRRRRRRRTVGQIPPKCKETSNLMWLSLIWFILVLFVCWNLFWTIANLRIKCVTETKNVFVLFYKNLKSSFSTWHIWHWGFFTFLVALAQGAAAAARSLQGKLEAKA